MNVKDIIGVVWFELTFFLSFCITPYLVYTASVWLYILSTFVMCVCVQIVKSQTKRREIKIRSQGIFITGCDTGFGHDLAERLDSIGFTVFAGCLHEAGQGARKLKGKCSRRLHTVQLDVCSEKSVDNALQYVKKHLPRKGLWAVVNNAGINIFGDVEICTVKVYQRAMDINLFGFIRVIHAFLPLIRKTKGRIVNVSSVMGRASYPGSSGYCATKRAIQTLSDALRMEMIKFGVKVIIIEPGHFGGVTGSTSNTMMKSYEEELEDMWNCASEDFKRIHTRQYIENILNRIRHGTQTSAPTTKPVLDAFQAAITEISPKTRYMVDGSNKLIDIHAFFARVYGFMPTWMYDFLFIKWTGCDKMPINDEMSFH